MFLFSLINSLCERDLVEIIIMLEVGHLHTLLLFGL